MSEGLNHVFDVEELDFSKRLLDQSNGLKTPVVIRNVINQELVEQLLTLSKEAIANLCQIKHTEFGFRLWQSGEKSSQRYIKEHIYENPPQTEESLGDWVDRVFNREEICMIMNNAEGFEDDIAIMLGKVFKSLLDAIGIPMNGTHSTTIFGNYTYTPLGIHHDGEGSFVLNLHLGPASKKMYTWDWDDYLALGGKMNEHDPTKYLPHAQEYIIHPGDLFFMPWDKFHIGYNEGFSLSMTNWFDFHLASRLTEELLLYLKKFMRVKMDFLSDAVTEDNHKEKFKELLDQFQFEGDKGNNSLKQNLIDAQEQKMLRFFSNAGWKSVPFTREASEGYDKMNFDSLLDKNLKLIEPFKIHTKKQGDHIYLFVRGHVRKYKYSETFDTLVQDLNSYKVFSYMDIMEYKPIDWQDDSWRYMISSLYDLRGLEIV